MPVPLNTQAARVFYLEEQRVEPQLCDPKNGLSSKRHRTDNLLEHSGHNRSE